MFSSPLAAAYRRKAPAGEHYRERRTRRRLHQESIRPGQDGSRHSRCAVEGPKEAPCAVQAARVMKFTSAKEIVTKAAIVKAYVGEAVAAAKAEMKVETRPPEFPV